eukprot:TRINITY_DN69_c0_g1_i11.p1 TRINITY_DN69_c0_g1~~TRINITY_DN69_c0_g1_i11.p1  ORF type:complete len:315 (-),score=38.69 TRINITY_DN69_c0_g1_i11:742-1686(-)
MEALKEVKKEDEVQNCASKVLEDGDFRYCEDVDTLSIRQGVSAVLLALFSDDELNQEDIIRTTRHVFIEHANEDDDKVLIYGRVANKSSSLGEKEYFRMDRSDKFPTEMYDDTHKMYDSTPKKVKHPFCIQSSEKKNVGWSMSYPFHTVSVVRTVDGSTKLSLRPKEKNSLIWHGDLFNSNFEMLTVDHDFWYPFDHDILGDKRLKHKFQIEMHFKPSKSNNQHHMNIRVKMDQNLSWLKQTMRSLVKNKWETLVLFYEPYGSKSEKSEKTFMENIENRKDKCEYGVESFVASCFNNWDRAPFTSNQFVEKNWR